MRYYTTVLKCRKCPGMWLQVSVMEWALLWLLGYEATSYPTQWEDYVGKGSVGKLLNFGVPAAVVIQESGMISSCPA